MTDLQINQDRIIHISRIKGVPVLSFIVSDVISDAMARSVCDVMSASTEMRAAFDSSAALLARPDTLNKKTLDSMIFSCDQAIRKCVPNLQVIEEWVNAGNGFLETVDHVVLGRFASLSPEIEDKAATEGASFPRLLNQLRVMRADLAATAAALPRGEHHAAG